MALLQTASLKIPATAGRRVAPHGSNLRSVFVGEGRGRLSLGRQLIVQKGQRRLHCVKASGTNDQSIKDIFLKSPIKGVFQFLWEQPGQIKEIEWPSLEITVKTALLTLVVVILLMVFLSAVDSFFRFLLASSMRRLS